MSIVESQYWTRNDGVFDALDREEYEEVGIMLEALTGEPMAGRNYDRYANASDSVVYVVLRALDESESLMPDWGPGYWTPYQCSTWLAANRDAIQTAEQSSRYLALVSRVRRALLQEPRPDIWLDEVED